MRLIDAASLLLLLCLGPLSLTGKVWADGFIGCLFNKSVCKVKTEWCYDDGAFGRCVSYDEATDKDYYFYTLDDVSLNLLKREMHKLWKSGHRWSSARTQCVLKNILQAIRYREEYDENVCKFFPEDPSFLDGSPEELDPQNVGKVQFTPSIFNPHADFADEIYIPTMERDEIFEDVVFPREGENGSKKPKYADDLQDAFVLKDINNNKRGREYNYNNNPFDIYQRNSPDDDDNLLSYLNEVPRVGDLRAVKELSDFIENVPLRNDGEPGEESWFEDLLARDRNILKSFSRNYNTPEKFRKGHETKDEVVYEKPYPSDVYYYPEERELVHNVFSKEDRGNEDGRREKEEGSERGVFTEGGIVYPKDDKKSEDSSSLEEMIGSWGFKRPERLDVKKPGPSINSLKINKPKPEEAKEKGRENGSKPLAVSQKFPLVKDLLDQPEKKKGGSPMESPSLRRQATTTIQPPKEKITEANDNSDFAYIKFKDKINTWQEGSRIIRKVEDMLNLRQNTFSNIRVEQNDVRFKVNPNRLRLNISEVVRRIDALKGPIGKAIGIEVVSAGVGNQNNLPPAVILLGEDEHQLWILSFLLCGIIAAIAIAGTVFFIVKRRPNARDKLANLSQMDSEASKDYQELCRARMASKAAQEKTEGNVAGHRVTNLAKEGDGTTHSPSSRSSTSSWSEEPALTNMDISTGHMVLSYMEDHLKNKGRLEQEWIALCAYEAEPCATTIALKGENAKKNRYNDVLPYDHARVVLNELSNIAGSDYINASTITDHDPRNPAYIASQGPLPQTTADFWQMIWEQGSVVMVMLTRLTENNATMCHRYWPEEGSELYHIYEVHLVSEHIWCDDYLVRSFYLKNLKTSETRTVTQFHFLSWPENGVPLSTKALLEFRRKVNKSYRGRSCPVVVHCSDGVGRTGTYCLIDMVLNRMAKGAKEIDIAATLEHIRDQRPMMVKTKQQFEFVLMAVAEEVHAILKALPANVNHSPPPVLKEKE